MKITTMIDRNFDELYEEISCDDESLDYDEEFEKLQNVVRNSNKLIFEMGCEDEAIYP